MVGTYNVGLSLCILGSIISTVTGHALMLEPTARSSLHQNPYIQSMFKLQTWGDCEYNNRYNLSAPWNCWDNSVNCGNRGDGVGIGQNYEYSNCGPCGDKLTDPRPRQNEHGGKYDKNIIIANYTQGQVIHTRAIVTNPHSGYMQWRLCAIANRTEDENGTWTDEVKACFDKNLLLRTDGTDRLKVNVWYRPNGSNWDSDNLKHNSEGMVYLQLPTNVTCERCVIQYTYRAGRTWKGTTDFDQETFRGCADVSIRPRNGTSYST